LTEDPYLKFLEPSKRRRFEWRSHLITFFLRHGRIAAAAFEIGELARFAAWCDSASKRQILVAKRFVTREALWDALAIPALRKCKKILVAEFGVASGVGALWWLGRLTSPSLVYRGFDTFLGMPVEFKGIPQGGLSLGGKPPNIKDDRIFWHVGDVCSTVLDVNWAEPHEVRIFLFDLDLYHPSLKVWAAIEPHLREGDLIFFDEAYNEDEFRLIREKVEHNNAISIIGFTAYSLLCRVVTGKAGNAPHVDGGDKTS
jgi:hypothetical protein